MYEILLELMKENNITPYRLSKETGITQATLSRWKTGKTDPSIETLQKIADYFDVSLDYLLGNVSEPFFYLDNERILKKINDTGAEPAQKEKPVLKKDEPEITFDDFTYAFLNESKELTEENKQKLLEMAKFFRQQQEKEN